MKLARLIAILMVLLNTNKTTAKTLAEEFEVSTRTIYRDLDTLLIAGIPIMTIQGINGGVYLDENYKLDKNYSSVNELSHLLIGLKGIGTALDDTNLKDAFEKVKHLIPTDMSEMLDETIEQVSIDLFTWTGHDEIKEKLKKVRQALTHTRVITFDYISNKNIFTTRSVEPYRLIYKEASWYLEAYCLNRKAFRIFKLTRMLKLKMTSKSFIKREFVPENQSSSGWVKDYLIYIDVEFDASILEGMVSVCGENQITKQSQTRYTAKMPFTDDTFSYNILMGYGHQIKCLGPQKIIDGYLKHIESIIKMYSKQ